MNFTNKKKSLKQKQLLFFGMSADFQNKNRHYVENYINKQFLESLNETCFINLFKFVHVDLNHNQISRLPFFTNMSVTVVVHFY
jgi:hypothetical protein